MLEKPNVAVSDSFCNRAFIFRAMWLVDVDSRALVAAQVMTRLEMVAYFLFFYVRRTSIIVEKKSNHIFQMFVEHQLLLSHFFVLLS